MQLQADEKVKHERHDQKFQQVNENIKKFEDEYDKAEPLHQIPPGPLLQCPEPVVGFAPTATTNGPKTYNVSSPNAVPTIQGGVVLTQAERQARSPQFGTPAQQHSSPMGALPET